MGSPHIIVGWERGHLPIGFIAHYVVMSHRCLLLLQHQQHEYCTLEQCECYLSFGCWHHGQWHLMKLDEWQHWEFGTISKEKKPERNTKSNANDSRMGVQNVNIGACSYSFKQIRLSLKVGRVKRVGELIRWVIQVYLLKLAFLCKFYPVHMIMHNMITSGRNDYRSGNRNQT